MFVIFSVNMTIQYLIFTCNNFNKVPYYQLLSQVILKYNNNVIIMFILSILKM